MCVYVDGVMIILVRPIHRPTITTTATTTTPQVAAALSGPAHAAPDDDEDDDEDDDDDDGGGGGGGVSERPRARVGAALLGALVEEAVGMVGRLNLKYRCEWGSSVDVYLARGTD